MPGKAFTAQTAVGQTEAFPVNGAKDHSIQLVVTGSPATGTYRLQGSNNGVDWFNISASDITVTSTTHSFELSKPAGYVRGNLLTLSGGSSPSVQLYYHGR